MNTPHQMNVLAEKEKSPESVANDNGYRFETLAKSTDSRFSLTQV